MPLDIEEGDAASVKIDGAACFYVLNEATGRELEVSIYRNTREDLADLRTALEGALRAKRIVILLRSTADALGPASRWETLDPAVFAGRLGPK